MDPKRYPRRGKIRRKSRNRKNINTKNIHFIDTSFLLPPILLSYHIKTCLFFVRIIFGHHRCTSSRHTHIFRLSTRFVYRLYIHIIVKFTRFPHNMYYKLYIRDTISMRRHFSGSGIHAPKGQKEPSQGQNEQSRRRGEWHPGFTDHPRHRALKGQKEKLAVPK